MRTGNVEERSETRRTRKLIRFKIMIMKTSRHDGCHRTRSRCGHTTDVSDDSTPPTDLHDYSKTISPQVNTYNSRGEDFYWYIILVITAGTLRRRFIIIYYIMLIVDNYTYSNGREHIIIFIKHKYINIKYIIHKACSSLIISLYKWIKFLNLYVGILEAIFWNTSLF